MPFGIGLVELLFVLPLFGLYIWALVVCAMKERWVWFVLGLFFGLFAFVGALGEAKSGSTWDRRKRSAAT